MEKMKFPRYGMTVVIAAFLLYAGVFIYRSSFFVNGERYFCLMDDAMISMRYARNLAMGLGMVWNAGERVEGFTNPLWTFYMAGLHLLPVGAAKVSLLVQITSMLLLAVNIWMVGMLGWVISKGSRFVAIAGAVLTAFYLPLNNWSLLGMEVGCLSLLYTLGTFLAIRNLTEGRYRWNVYAILGLALWVRMDAVVIFLAVWLFLIRTDPCYRMRHLWQGGLVLVFMLGGQMLLRYGYYHEWLPNTYFVKMTGYPIFLRIARGFYVYLEFLWRTNLILVLLPFVVWALKRNWMLSLLLWIFAVMSAYSIYVGGDAWEWWGCNRFLCTVMPLFFVSLCYSVEVIITFISSRFEAIHSEKWAMWGRGAMLVLMVLILNAYRGPGMYPEFFLMRRPMLSEDTSRRVLVEEALKPIIDSQATVAVVQAGAAPYFLNNSCIDLLGKCEAAIARTPMHRHEIGMEKIREFWPGHMKWNYDLSIVKYKPDVIFELWFKDPGIKYLQNYQEIRLGDQSVWFKKDSSHINWEKVKQASSITSLSFPSVKS
jgi:hypothetical protein